MISAFLNGKLSSKQENMEDMLTSCVFDTFRHSDSNELLFKWLHEAQTTDGYRPFENLDSDLSVTFRFWPTLNADGCYRCEPDVILEIGGDNGYSILIEAKLHSDKSSHADEADERETDQLAKEWVNLLGELSEKSSNRKPYLIYLTADIGPPIKEIEESIANISSGRSEAQNCFCWLSWRQLSAFDLNCNHPAFSDLLNLLERLQLVFYSGVSFDNELADINWRFDRLDNVIWSRQIHIPDLEWRFKNEDR